MCNLLIHRGPDDFGYFTDSNISIGIRRLAIIDLKRGHQPQHNENEDIWIIFNGEIYNFKVLRNDLEEKGHIFYTNSDTEVIIHSYEEWGADCVNKLRGQFAICIYDSIKKELFLARDYLGLKPLYYYFDGERFIFGSEIKCILCHDIKREINKKAIDYYLSFGYIPSNFTMFQEIYKVPASSYLIFDLKNKKFQIKKYWNIDFKINDAKTINQLAHELKEMIEESIKIRLISEVPLGAFLSGGLDSSSIVALMSKNIDTPIKTFSIGFGGGAPINETKYAKSVSDYFNTDHTEILIESPDYKILSEIIWYLDDLISDAAVLPIYFMSKYSKKEITVALSGDGADELFAGYSVYYRANERRYLKYLPKYALKVLMKSYNIIPSYKYKVALSILNEPQNKENRYMRALYVIPDIEKAIATPFKTHNANSIIKSTFMKNSSLINQLLNWELNYQLPNQYNMKVDKMSMAVSIETRIPFLDHEIVRWSSSIPSNLKLKGNVEKYILRMAMRDILPPEILKRKKQGFGTPINLWLNTGLKEISGEILKKLEKRTKLINNIYVKKVRRNRCHKLFKNRVWNLLMFELWYETFIEQEELKPLKF